jgi:hypothetical protein
MAVLLPIRSPNCRRLSGRPSVQPFGQQEVIVKVNAAFGELEGWTGFAGKE